MPESIEQLYHDQAEYIQNVSDEDITEEEIVAHLLILESLMLNWPHWCNTCKNSGCEHVKAPHIAVLCNDLFMWASGDAQDIRYDQLKELWSFYKKDPRFGIDVWCCKERNLKPQRPIREEIKREGIWDLDTMGLRPGLDET